MPRSLSVARRTEHAADPSSPSENADPLLSFNAESATSPVPSTDTLPESVIDQPARVGLTLRQLAILLAVLLLAVAAVVAYGSGQRQVAPPTVSTTGTAAIASRPEGLEVAVDGVVLGTTPLELTLSVGAHRLEIGSGSAKRTLPLSIEPGARATQYVELVVAPEAPTGQLEVTSNPAGAQVRVDGAIAGRTPLSLPAIAAGEHSVAVDSAGGFVTHTVTVTAGATASVFATVAPSNAAGGWIALDTAVDLEIYEGERLVGTTAADRLMLPAGRHELVLVNAALEFRKTVTVDVAPARTVATSVILPDGSLSINALPWANISIDGRPVGITPLANLPVPIGSHEVVWRHPELGERRRIITVTAVSPVRIGMDLSQ